MIDTRNSEMKHVTYNEYFTRKRSEGKHISMDSVKRDGEMNKRHSQSTILNSNDEERRISTGYTKNQSYDRSQKDLTISICDPNKEEYKICSSFESPSMTSITLKSANIARLPSSTKKRTSTYKRFMDRLKHFKTELPKKKSQVKSNRVLPKYKPAEIQTEYSKKSLKVVPNTVSGSFQGEKFKFARIHLPNNDDSGMPKHKSISQKRLNESIFKSLNEIKQSLKKGSSQDHI